MSGGQRSRVPPLYSYKAEPAFVLSWRGLSDGRARRFGQVHVPACLAAERRARRAAAARAAPTARAIGRATHAAIGERRFSPFGALPPTPPLAVMAPDGGSRRQAGQRTSVPLSRAGHGSPLSGGSAHAPPPVIHTKLSLPCLTELEGGVTEKRDGLGKFTSLLVSLQNVPGAEKRRHARVFQGEPRGERRAPHQASVSPRRSVVSHPHHP